MHARTHDDRRHATRVPVELDVHEHTEGALYFQRTRDLSLEGAFLQGTLPHPPGTRVELDLALPDAPLRVAAEVVARDEARGMAVRFVDVRVASRLRLAEFLFG